MTIDTILANLGLIQRQPNALETQINALRSEMRRVARSVSRQASHATDEWGQDLSELGREAARQSAYLAGVASHQAVRGVKAFQRDPLPAIAVIGTAFLLARMLRR